MKKVLIANRGEIAVRIARACADYGVSSVAVYADADFNALHTQVADEAYALEGKSATQTYLNLDKLLSIAHQSGADAVHPGYGFLSESADFARAVINAGLTWIGPSPASIEQLGDKVQARKIAMQVGAPLVQGTTDPVTGAAEVVAFAREHGLPIAIKAAFGGGGRGLKVAWQLDEVEELYASAVREATAAFGRGECFVEQYLDRPRHVEVQVLADQHGNVQVLGTRDCSLQRRNQKLVEEAPAPFLSEDQHRTLMTAARDICAQASYVGAGTVEFLLSTSGAISFLEVNTRLQVEHPITEETSGIDLVVEQLRIADGLPLASTETPTPRGHAFEFRLNAEDVGRGFLPTPGSITTFSMPSGPGIRVDSGVDSGSRVPGEFDSLMAKLIVTGATRKQAIARARRALQECRIEGVASVLPFHQAVMQHDDFVGQDNFKVHTRWIETQLTDLPTAERPQPAGDVRLHHTVMEINGRRVKIGLPVELLNAIQTIPEGALPQHQQDGPQAQDSSPEDGVLSPITGNLLSWSVEDGALVEPGDTLAIMEAMKMETTVTASRRGRVQLLTKAGEQVEAATLIARLIEGD